MVDVVAVVLVVLGLGVVAVFRIVRVFVFVSVVWAEVTGEDFVAIGVVVPVGVVIVVSVVGGVRVSIKVIFGVVVMVLSVVCTWCFIVWLLDEVVEEDWNVVVFGISHGWSCNISWSCHISWSCSTVCWVVEGMVWVVVVYVVWFVEGIDIAVMFLNCSSFCNYRRR